MSKISLEALEVLDAIDRKGSFAAAAAALYRVPSKITYTVNKLEEDLGVTLFVRQGRKSVLTPAGQLLLERGRDLLDAADRMIENARQVHSGWESCLRIAVDSVIDFSVIYPHLDGLYQQQPDIDVHLYEEVLGGAWESILDGRVDVVIGAPDGQTNTRGLLVEKLYDQQWVFAVARNHPLARQKRAVTDEDIKQFRAVVVRDSSRERPALTRRVLDKQPRLTVPSVQQKISAQLNGQGVGYLPRELIGEYLTRGDLVTPELEQAPSATGLFLVWKTVNKGRALKWLIESLRKDKTLRPDV